MNMQSVQNTLYVQLLTILKKCETFPKTQVKDNHVVSVMKETF